MITVPLDQFLTMKASGQKTDQVALVLTTAQLELVRTALVERKQTLNKLLSMWGDPQNMSHARTIVARLDELLVMVAKA
jgi:hypothetical protein